MVGWTPSKIEPRPPVPPPVKKGTTTSSSDESSNPVTRPNTPPNTHFGYRCPRITSAKKPFVVVKPPEPIEEPPPSPREPVPHRSAGYGQSGLFQIAMIRKVERVSCRTGSSTSQAERAESQSVGQPARRLAHPRVRPLRGQVRTKRCAHLVVD